MRAQEEIKRIQSVPLVIGQFMEAIDQKYALPCLKVVIFIIRLTAWQYWYRAELDRF